MTEDELQVKAKFEEVLKTLNPMNEADALAEAQRRWGPKAYTKISHDGAPEILVAEYTANLPVLLGWGRTWDEALALAITRAEWHKHLNRPTGDEADGWVQPPLI